MAIVTTQNFDAGPYTVLTDGNLEPVDSNLNNLNFDFDLMSSSFDMEKPGSLYNPLFEIPNKSLDAFHKTFQPPISEDPPSSSSEPGDSPRSDAISPFMCEFLSLPDFDDAMLQDNVADSILLHPGPDTSFSLFPAPHLEEQEPSQIFAPSPFPDTSQESERDLVPLNDKSSSTSSISSPQSRSTTKSCSRSSNSTPPSDVSAPEAKPPKKRGRKRSNLSAGERRARRLERGRVAATKCRKKRKEMEEELQSRVSELLVDRDKKTNDLNLLRRESLVLQEELLRHGGADCEGLSEKAREVLERRRSSVGTSGSPNFVLEEVRNMFEGCSNKICGGEVIQ